MATSWPVCVGEDWAMSHAWSKGTSFFRCCRQAKQALAPSGIFVPQISYMLSLYFSYSWNLIWIYRSWNVAYEFMIMKYYLNSWLEFRYEVIIMKNIVNHIRIHTYELVQEFRLLNSYIWSHIWIHVMTSPMNSVTWRISWNHGWIPTTEFT